MSLQITIVDDESDERENLKEYCKRFLSEKKQQYSLFCFSSAEEYLAAHIRQDIIIFDVDMPGMNGIEAAKRVREIDSDVIILFVTKIAQYAINGYEVDAIDYVLKPLSYFDFVLKMEKIMKRLAKGKSFTLTLDTVDGIRPFSVAKIYYVDVMLHYINIHTDEGVFKARGSMRDIEKALSVYFFARCHKSYVVNLKHVRTIRPAEVELSNGEVLPLGRTQKENFMQEYVRYVKG